MKNKIFEITIILQTWNIKNWNTTGAKFFCLDIINNLFKYFLESAGVGNYVYNHRFWDVSSQT